MNRTPWMVLTSLGFRSKLNNALEFFHRENETNNSSNRNKLLALTYYNTWNNAVYSGNSFLLGWQTQRSVKVDAAAIANMNAKKMLGDRKKQLLLARKNACSISLISYIVSFVFRLQTLPFLTWHIPLSTRSWYWIGVPLTNAFKYSSTEFSTSKCVHVEGTHKA